MARGDGPIRLEPAHDRQPPAIRLVETGVQSAAEQTGSATSNVWPTSRPVNQAGVTPTTVNGLIEKRQRAADRGLATAKVGLPERVTHDRRSGAASAAIVAGREQPSTLGCDAEHREEVSAHPEPARAARLAAAADEELGVSPQANIAENALWWRSNLLPQADR